MFTHVQKDVSPNFLCQNVAKEILFTGTKFHAKPSRGSRVILKSTTVQQKHSRNDNSRNNKFYPILFGVFCMPILFGVFCIPILFFLGGGAEMPPPPAYFLRGNFLHHETLQRY